MARLSRKTLLIWSRVGSYCTYWEWCFAVTQLASNECASRRLFSYVRTVLVSAIASSVIGICASSRRRGLIVTTDAHLHLVQPPISNISNIGNPVRPDAPFSLLPVPCLRLCFSLSVAVYLLPFVIGILTVLLVLPMCVLVLQQLRRPQR